MAAQSTFGFGPFQSAAKRSLAVVIFHSPDTASVTVLNKKLLDFDSSLTYQVPVGATFKSEETARSDTHQSQAMNEDERGGDELEAPAVGCLI